MLELLQNPYVHTIGIMLIFRNLIVSLPKPDATVTGFFGGNGPGYVYLYKVLQGLSGDVRALGVDPKTLTDRFVKKENGNGNGGH